MWEGLFFRWDKRLHPVCRNDNVYARIDALANENAQLRTLVRSPWDALHAAPVVCVRARASVCAGGGGGLLMS